MELSFDDGAALEAQCMPFLEGSIRPATAVELMASRYIAHRRRDFDYLQRTHDPKTRTAVDSEPLESIEWTGLQILRHVDGGTDDDQGQVEFVAHYVVEGKVGKHHELSEFRRIDGAWYYVRGGPPPTRSARVGRNDPCPCGSGKKHKKCCGR